MNRYRKIFLPIAVLAALSGCSKDAERRADGNEITFRPAASTKSEFTGIIQNTIFPEDKTFSMNAFVLPLDEAGQPKYTGGSYFMMMETVSYTDDPVRSDPYYAWRTSAHHYWPISGCCYFVGIHPTLADMMAHKMIGPKALTADNYGTLMIKDITIKHTDAENNPIEVDSLKKDTNLSHATVDIMSGSYLITDVKQRASNSVPVQFAHHMAQINFSLEAAKDYSSHELDRDTLGTKWYWTHWQQFWVDEIMMTNVYSTATFSLSAPHWPSDSLKNLYTYYPLRRGEQQGTQAVYTTGGGGVPSDDITQIEQFGTRTPISNYIKDSEGEPLSILLFPQRFPATAQIRIKICSRSLNMLAPKGSGNLQHIMNDETVSYYKTINLSDIMPVLVAGTSFTIRFVASLDSIDCSVDYSEWKEGGNSDIQQ